MSPWLVNYHLTLGAGRGASRFWAIGVVFFLSGVPALLYQLCWQRMLLTVYGVNIESITVVVSAFMLGLGLGSLAGGRLAKLRAVPRLLIFAAFELVIGIYGTTSTHLFRAVADFTLGASLGATAAFSFALIVLPTILMGASLPLLVAHLLERSKNMGKAVGLLYFFNTLGSAVGCFIAAQWLFQALGLSGTLRVAAGINLLVAMGALVVHVAQSQAVRKGETSRFEAQQTAPPSSAPPPTTTTIKQEALVSFPLVVCIAAVSGFISLAYEIILARTYSLVSAGTAQSFPMMLGWYLTGIALGSLGTAVYCEGSKLSPARQLRVVGGYFAVVTVLGYLTLPIIGHAVRYVPYSWTYPLVALLSAGLGAILPLVTHVSIAPDELAAKKVSYLYVANIIGSTVGSLITGFIAMDYLPLSTIVMLLSLGGLLLALYFLFTRAKRTEKLLLAMVALIASFAIIFVNGAMFDDFYERLVRKNTYDPLQTPFRHINEGRSGVVAVTVHNMVLGGGIYDGRISTDLVHDQNVIVRPFMLSAFHAHPQRVLVIGLSTGAWTQVLLNHPEVEQVIAVEIDSGYLKIINKSEIVRSLLTNPKLVIQIDDGRRWLASHPDERFDLIVMNTTFNWRSYTSNLLSVEFLQELRKHLKFGGIAIYNTTGSAEVQRTGATSFPYVLRFSNNLLVSNEPLVANEMQFRKILSEYKIEGEPVFRLNEPLHQKRLEEVVALLHNYAQDPTSLSFESKNDILKRTKQVRLITDDNMGTEWLPQE